MGWRKYYWYSNSQHQVLYDTAVDEYKSKRTKGITTASREKFATRQLAWTAPVYSNDKTIKTARHQLIMSLLLWNSTAERKMVPQNFRNCLSFSRTFMPSWSSNFISRSLTPHQRWELSSAVSAPPSCSHNYRRKQQIRKGLEQPLADSTKQCDGYLTPLKVERWVSFCHQPAYLLTSTKPKKNMKICTQDCVFDDKMKACIPLTPMSHPWITCPTPAGKLSVKSAPILILSDARGRH